LHHPKLRLGTFAGGKVDGPRRKHDPLTATNSGYQVAGGGGIFAKGVRWVGGESLKGKKVVHLAVVTAAGKRGPNVSKN